MSFKRILHHAQRHYRGGVHLCPCKPTARKKSKLEAQTPQATNQTSRTSPVTYAICMPKTNNTVSIEGRTTGRVYNNSHASFSHTRKQSKIRRVPLRGSAPSFN